MAMTTLAYRFHRFISVILLGFALITLTLVLMNGSTAAQPLPDAESPGAAGLEIDMLGADTVRAGHSITFTIMVTNSTGQNLPNVVITDSWYLLTYNGNFQLNNLSVVTYSFRPTATQPYIRWELGTLAAGASGSIVMSTDVTVTLQPSTTKAAIGSPTLLANTAAIATSAPGVPSANNGVNPMVIGPVMYLEKTFLPANQRPGRLVTFTLKLTNRPLSERADSISSTNTIITEIIPARTTLWSVLPGSGVTYDYLDSMRLLTYYLASPVQPGQSAYVTFTARLSPTLKNASDVAAVRNNRSGFGFRSTEVTIPRPGDADVPLTGNEVIEKSVQVGPPPPTVGNPPRTFPNRMITYTIGVYNPYTETLSGMRLTDTLPQAFAGGPYFIYSETLPVAPFSAPAVISVSGRTVVWDLPDIGAWDVYSFALRVWVPANFDTSTNLNGRTVDNSIYAVKLPERPVVYDNLIPVEAKVTVVPQIIPAKTIALPTVYSGFPETYTLWLTNTGNTNITNIRITDTLPTSQWTFQEMIFGPTPVITTPQVVWQGIDLPAYSGARLTFRVKAVGVPPPSGGNYCNNTAGSSPDTFIPSLVNVACMQFLNPFTLYKIALAPNGYVVLGNGFSYRITIGNVSFMDYAITQILDDLPPNFNVLSGGGLYIATYVPPAALLAGSSFETQFDVMATSVPPEVCNKLPTNIVQAGGQVAFTLAGPPEATWVNGGNLAPVMVYPHVGLLNTSELPGAAPGELVTYTIVLTNHTSNNYTNIILSDTLPAVDGSNAFEFARMAPGSTVPAPQVNGRVLTWPGLSLAPDSILRFTFVTTATQLPGENLENDVVAIDVNDPITCIPWLGTGVNAKPGARVNVRVKKMEYNKTVNPLSVGPLGLVQYDVRVYNRGPYTVSNIVVTDVLPTSIAEPYWQFNSNVSLPAGVTYLGSDPPTWRIDQINTNGNVNFSFKARASIFPGSGYKNYMIGFAPTWIFTEVVNYLGAPVTIVPGAALDKIVSSKTANAGDRVVYTVTLYNQSGASLMGMRITDTLPTGFAYDGMVSPAAPIPDTTSPLVWGSRLPTSLPNQQRLELAFYARISSTLKSGVYYNKVRATARDISIPPTDDTAPVQVYGAPSVAVSKVADKPSVFYNDTLIYTITLRNEGMDPISVRVTDTLPTGFNLVWSPIPPVQPQPLVWDNIVLAQGETRDLGFVVSVSPSAPTGTVYNQVNLSGAGYVFPGTGPTAPVLVKAQPTYDLRVAKDGMPKFVQTGDLVTYTIVYANDTNDDITVSNVVLTDTLPAADVTVIGADSPCWAELVPGTWLCNVGDLAPQQTGVVTLVLQLNATPPENYFLNQVTIGGTAPLNAAEDNVANNTATALTFAGIFPEVVIDKTVTPVLAFTGDPVTYTMVLTNNSSVMLTLRVTDTLPTGFVFGNVIGPTPAPATTAPLVWSNLVLQPGQSIMLAWSAVVGASTPPGFYYNVVDLDANGLVLPGRTDLAQIETDMRRYYAIQISKSDGQTRGTPGSTLNYTIRYTNTSTNVTLTQVALTDSFSPTGSLSFLSSGWTQAAPGVYTQARPDLPPGSSTALIVQLQLASSLPPDLLAISNTVVITAVPALRATELITSNHTATDIDIVGGADLAITDLKVMPARVRNGGTITAVVTVVNQGFVATLGPNSTGWFGVDLYVKPESGTAPGGPGDRYYGLCPAAGNYCPNTARWGLYRAVKEYNGVGLNVDETAVLTYTYVVPDALLPNKGPLWIYAQADMYWGQGGTAEFGTADHGRILEGDEVNNISGPVAIYLNPGVYLPIIRR